MDRGEYGGKAFKRRIADRFNRKDLPKPLIRELIEHALIAIPDHVLDARVEDELTEEPEEQVAP